MELWIRSQDKRILQKVGSIFLDANYENKRISAYDENYIELGTYKTKERAIEILDEMQQYISLPNIDNSAYIYQMPEK